MVSMAIMGANISPHRHTQDKTAEVQLSAQRMTRSSGPAKRLFTSDATMSMATTIFLSERRRIAFTDRTFGVPTLDFGAQTSTAAGSRPF